MLKRTWLLLLICLKLADSAKLKILLGRDRRCGSYDLFDLIFLGQGDCIDFSSQIDELLNLILNLAQNFLANFASLLSLIL